MIEGPEGMIEVPNMTEVPDDDILPSLLPQILVQLANIGILRAKSLVES